ncbi:septum formation family protein [Actinomadura sp. LCR2-06]|uniref:Septum formation family protein n=2 Tax=Actinomadura violacea TaxID=2819934 RepID=A0ABS3RSL2_9ACTN|nr:septum formation family protein [Actinomadura violacea]
MPPAPVQRRTNPYAKVALAAGIIGMILFSVGFAIAAFVQIRRRGERGRGLAVGGLAASLVWIVVGGLIAATVLLSPERDGSGQITASGKTVLSRLKTGDCFTGFGEEASQVIVTALPCTRPHDGEIVADAALPDDNDFPGDKGLEAEANKVCTDRLEFLTKSRYYKDLEIYVAKPGEPAWRSGDRQVVCAMRYTGAGTLSAPLATSIDPDMKTLREVEVGDCFTEWELTATASRGVPCTERHRVQVYAAFELPWQGLDPSRNWWEYPGDKLIDKHAKDGCNRRADKVFAKNPPPVEMETYYLAPTKRDWDFSVRNVICLASVKHGTLKRSVLGK